MKKLILLLAIFTYSAVSFEAHSDNEAESTSGGTSLFYDFKYGVEAGLTLFNQLNKYDGESYNDDINSMVGFHLAATALYTITTTMFVLTMLDLSMKGYKYNSSGSSSSSYKLNLLYLQLPILFAYNIAVIQAYTISALVGPYFAVGLSGKYKWDDGDSKVEFGKDNNYRRADYGAIFGLMVMRDLFTFRVAYQLGLKNIHPTGDYDAILKNRGFNFSVGYFFNCGR